ncbi:MAG: hypothetical protein ACJ79K_03760 [Gemmatimonadaceae bacterium]
MADSSPPVPPAPPAGSDPTAPGTSGVPARQSLDRRALDRILKRAGELQVSAADPAEEMTEEQLIALGQEVGITPQHLRQAIAEERTRPALPDEPGFADRWIGPRTVSARRVIRGTREQLLSRLDEWMRREECLQVKRRLVDRVVWEPRRDVFGSIRRGLNLGGRSYALTRTHDVAATAIAIDSANTLVQIDADLRPARAARVRGGTAVATTGTVAGASMVGIGIALGLAIPLLPLVAIAAVPVAAGAGIGVKVARGFRGTAERVQLSLEQALDSIEHGEPPRPRVGDVLGLIGRRP